MSIVVRGLAVLMAVFSLSATAATREYKYEGDGSDTWYTGRGIACQAWRMEKLAEPNKVNVTAVTDAPDTYRCEARFKEGGGFAAHVALLWREAGTCQEGNTQKIEFKIGWAQYFNTPDGGQIPLANGTSSVTPLPPQGKLPLDACVGGCRYYYDGGEQYWVNPDTLSQGNVQRYASARYKSSDMECTESTDTDLSGDNPGPPDTDPGNPDDPGDPGDNDNPGGNNGENPGGGNSGGPDHNTGDGGDPGDDDSNGPGGGNNQNPAEPQCGVGGKPPCNTSIDESGTPSGPGDKMDTGKIGEQFDKLRDQLDRIKNKGDKDTSWGVFPSWFRTGSCQPWNFGAFGATTLSIDYCPAVPYAQAAASFMWLVVTFFAVTGMVSRTLGGGARS